MPTRTKAAPSAGKAAATGATSPDSGIWARSRTAPARRQEPPLRGSAWLGWCAALLFFVGVVGIVYGTLLHLTRELVELGQHGSHAGVDER